MNDPSPLAELLADLSGIGEDIHRLAGAIFPICRSITGNGVRRTLAILAQHVAIERHEVATGTQVFDWEVPKEWNIADAWIKDAHGNRMVDFQRSNLHVMSYSTPVRRTMTFDELKPHLFTLPLQPGLIPYRTSYYAERWGFCLTHDQLAVLARHQGALDVCIDSDLQPGSLTYGEHLHRGESSDEVILSAHICHPSLANDNCSGLALLTLLAKALQGRKTRLSYRFLFVPGTIGSLAWLAANEAHVGRIKHGLVLSCVGDGGGPTYKRSRRGDALIDRAMAHVLKASATPPKLLDFSPYGYDERQFCSPGFNLPVGLFQRSQFATFPEYHTSADTMDFIKPEHLEASFRWVVAALDILERDRRFINLSPKGEPQLGKRGLYASVGGDRDTYTTNMATLWVLNLSDGEWSLLDIAERAGMPFREVADAAARLKSAGLLEPAD